MSPRGGKREGAGRPRGDVEVAALSLNVEASLLAAVRAEIARRGVTMREWVEAALRGYG